jgi:hypothetical protein
MKIHELLTRSNLQAAPTRRNLIVKLFQTSIKVLLPRVGLSLLQWHQQSKTTKIS